MKRPLNDLLWSRDTFTDAESSKEGMITVQNIEANVPTVVQRNGPEFHLAPI